MAAVGIDPTRFLLTKDSVERTTYLKVLERAVELKKVLDHNLAIEIANAVGKLFG